MISASHRNDGQLSDRESSVDERNFIIDRKVRKNAFTCPPSGHLIFTLVWTMLEVLIFCSIYCPYIIEKLSLGLAITAIIVIFIFLLLMVILAYIIMKSDPTEPLMYGVVDKNYRYEFQWRICKTFAYEETKHWSKWNRWVTGFDHHWLWLNNCIAKINYRYFIALIYTYTFYNLWYLAITLSVIIKLGISKFYILNILK